MGSYEEENAKVLVGKLNRKLFILQALQRTEDGLRSSIAAPIGEIETGTETADRFQSRMELSAERLWKIRFMLQYDSVSEQELTHRIWEPDVEEEYESNDEQDEDDDEQEEGEQE